NGIGVIMDMVYNHTGKTEESVLNQTVPGYFYRQKADKTYSNASGCGNETASERYMMRKFMIESLVYWAKEYHIDGFRIDLMGIHDIITMNEISDALRTINPNILIYGEGWTAGESPLPDSLRALKNNTYKLKNISVFSDELRDGVKGHWSDHKAKGFISGQTGLEESIKFGIAGGIHHHQVHYNQVNNSKKAWALEPYQCINYVSCHDDNTLWDKILISAPEVDESSRIKMDLLANTIVFTSQGIPFMLAGEEFLRTKQLVSNSYKSPDNINQIDWDRKKTYQHVFEYYKKLIQMRKNHPSLRMTDSETIKKNLHFLSFTKQNIIGYTIKHGKTSGDTWDEILVIFNGNKEIEHIPIPGGKWKVIVENTHFLEEEKIIENNIKVEGTSAFIIVK
ncbi:MAG: type I pullulanase, partial [Chitinophagaceae bacterium]|nr:type I pullulanase [Chitinophagaceae bacterium]